jgi:hypothetical protein
MDIIFSEKLKLRKNKFELKKGENLLINRFIFLDLNHAIRLYRS